MRQQKRAFLVLGLLGGGLLGLYGGGPASPGLALDLEPGDVGQLVSGQVRAAGGLGSRVEVWAVDREGDEYLAYEEDLRAWTSRLDFVFFKAPGLQALRARAGGQEVFEDLEPGSPGAKGLTFLAPYAEALEGKPPQQIEVEPGSPPLVAWTILNRLPLGPRPLGSLAVLGGFAALAAAWGALGHRASSRPLLRLGLLAFACLSVGLLSLGLLPGKPRLVLVDLPPTDHRGFVGGTFVRQESRPERPETLWYRTAEGSSGLSCFALACPRDSGLPLEALRAGATDRFVFSTPPRIRGQGGQWAVMAPRPLHGWRLHEPR